MQRTLFNSDHHSLIEEKVSDRPGSYRNLNSKALYTSQDDFRNIFSHPLVQGTFVDLGCGTGHGCLMYSQMFSDRQAIGLDCEEARINEGLLLKESLNLTNVDLLVMDLEKDKIPAGDTDFLYFPTGHVLDRVLSELYSLKKKFTLIAIESHGDLLPRLELENWLELKDEIPLFAERHYPKARVYRSSNAQRLVPQAFLISNSDLVLFIEDENGLWLGSSFGLSWEGGDRFNLMTPPRTIDWISVKSLKARSELSSDLQQLLSFRDAGLVTIETQSRLIEGNIRKIYLSPVFHLEISNGEKVELSEIKKINIRA